MQRENLSERRRRGERGWGWGREREREEAGSEKKKKGSHGFLDLEWFCGDQGDACK